MAYTSRHSGRQVRELVADLDCGTGYYTNAVECFPADRAGPSDNRDPTADERANCRLYPVEEIEDVDPEVVLATGSHATRSVLSATGRSLDGGFVEAALDPVALPELGTTLVPVLHPSDEAVWRARLGYEERGTYVAAVRTALTV